MSGAIGLVAVPPVLLETGYGIWKENRLDQEVWQVIDKAVSATKLELEYKTVRPEPGLPGNSSGAAPRCRCRPRRMRWVHLEMRATASRAGTYGRGRRLLPRRTAASAVGGMGYQRPVPGHLSPFGWNHLAVGARCLVGGVRRPTVRGRCYRRPEGAAASTDALQLCSARRRLQEVEQGLTTSGTYGIFEC